MRDEEIIALLRLAQTEGVSIFDTAPSYGRGRGEHIMGKSLLSGPSIAPKSDSGSTNDGVDRSHHMRDPFLMTKVGLWPRHFRRPRRDFSTAAVKASILASKKRLGNQTIDLVWLHGADIEDLTTELLTLLTQIKAQGWVRHFGLAGRGVEVLQARNHDLFEAAMMPLNRFYSDQHLEMAITLRSHGKIVFAIEALSAQSLQIHSRAGLWRGARKFVRGIRPAKQLGASSSSRADTLAAALCWPITNGLADIVLSSTTVKRHLCQNIETISDKKAFLEQGITS